jgi:hypothetical protein
MEEYFRKVVIKSESDLPKEEGEYTISILDSDTPTGGATFNHLPKTIKWWLANIHWYLLPVSQEHETAEETILVDDPNYPNMGRRITKKEYEAQFKNQSTEIKSAEEMIKEYRDELMMNQPKIDLDNPVQGFPGWWEDENVAELMRKYASQFQKETVTDEEIEKAADEAYKATDGLLDAYGTAGFEKGAKWMRTKLYNK